MLCTMLITYGYLGCEKVIQPRVFLPEYLAYYPGKRVNLGRGFAYPLYVVN